MTSPSHAPTRPSGAPSCCRWNLNAHIAPQQLQPVAPGGVGFLKATVQVCAVLGSVQVVNIPRQMSYSCSCALEAALSHPAVHEFCIFQSVSIHASTYPWAALALQDATTALLSCSVLALRCLLELTQSLVTATVIVLSGGVDS